MTEGFTPAAVSAAVAFEELFEAERMRLFRALCLMTRDRGEAEELTQDAFLRCGSGGIASA